MISMQNTWLPARPITPVIMWNTAIGTFRHSEFPCESLVRLVRFCCCCCCCPISRPYSFIFQSLRTIPIHSALKSKSNTFDWAHSLLLFNLSLRNKQTSSRCTRTDLVKNRTRSRFISGNRCVLIDWWFFSSLMRTTTRQPNRNGFAAVQLVVDDSLSSQQPLINFSSRFLFLFTQNVSATYIDATHNRCNDCTGTKTFGFTRSPELCEP